VPAILSASAWQDLNVQPGTVFHIFTAGGTRDPIKYLAVTSVAHIPPANESIESGMLVDFQALQAAYQHQKATLPGNYIWLHTNTDVRSLAQVRHALSTSPLALNNLADRQALVQMNATNPLVLNLLATLSIGVCTALLLALLANLLLPVLSIRARLTSFAFLRALGAAPAQVLRLLIWEQGLVLASALLLGTLLGFPLALIAVPALIVNSIPLAGAQVGGANAIYLAQGILPARVVLPPSLLLALSTLLALCILALLAISRIALGSRLSQQIRLNED
jgi:ABC-type lipoprotein release transport system permease subunit